MNQQTILTCKIKCLGKMHFIACFDRKGIAQNLTFTLIKALLTTQKKTNTVYTRQSIVQIDSAMSSRTFLQLNQVCLDIYLTIRRQITIAMKNTLKKFN